MFRRSRLQRSLITLLALLIVTPQVLLRPCCCVQERMATAEAARQTATVADLPPCCRQRMEASRKITSVPDAIETHPALPGVHDAGKCRCRVVMQVARTNRVILNLELLRPVALEVLAPLSDAGSPVSPPLVTLTSADSVAPDSGLAHCARLCRWLV